MLETRHRAQEMRRSTIQKLSYNNSRNCKFLFDYAAIMDKCSYHIVFLFILRFGQCQFYCHENL